MAALGSRALTLLIDGEERAVEVSRAVFSNADTDSDFVSFASAAAGGSKDWSLLITATQDPGNPASLLNLAWASAGDEVEVTVRPYGNATPSDTQPHYTSTCVVTLPDGETLGGEADPSQSRRWTVEMAWPCTAQPVMVTGGVSPTLTSVTPATGGQGDTVIVSIVGTGFDPSPTVAVSGTGVTVSSVTRPTSALIYATFTIAGGATIAARNVTITNTDATTVTGTGAFEVTA